jgi:hypothetical protein
LNAAIGKSFFLAATTRESALKALRKKIISAPRLKRKAFFSREMLELKSYDFRFLSYTSYLKKITNQTHLTFSSLMASSAPIMSCLRGYFQGKYKICLQDFGVNRKPNYQRTRKWLPCLAS